MSLPQEPFHTEVVPVEIWERIFQLTLLQPWKTQPGDRNKRSHRDAPLSISQTCSTWRDIAIDIPHLWTILTVKLHDNKLSPNIELVNLWLDRSMNAPLSIDLHMVDVDVEFDLETSSYKCLKILFSHIARWKHATLYVRGFNLGSLFGGELVINGAPLLESLTLDIQSRYNGPGTLLPSALWADAPRLHKLLLLFRINEDIYSNGDDYYLNWATSSNIPFSQITSLHIHTKAYEVVDIEEVISIFKSTPNLVSFLIGNICDRFSRSFDYTTPPVMLQHLKYLHLRRSSDQFTFGAALTISITEILNYLTAPSLKTLALADGTMWRQQSFNNFITRSGCELEEMHFFNTPVRPENFRECMRLSPSVRGVHIGYLNDTQSDPDFVDRMTAWDARRGTFVLCPNLAWLSLPRSYVYDLFSNNSQISIIAKVLRTRLCPPDGSAKAFKRLYVPSDRIYTEAYRAIRALCVDPYGLDTESDDDMFGWRAVWDRYGDR